MEAGLVPLQLKKHKTDHRRNRENPGTLRRRCDLRRAAACVIFLAAAE
jgi:hypothetical protein